jgi:Tat protein secretion system quality control protein TatD with DNase activity
MQHLLQPIYHCHSVRATTSLRRRLGRVWSRGILHCYGGSEEPLKVFAPMDAALILS